MELRFFDDPREFLLRGRRPPVDRGQVVATAVRTAPFGEYPAYLMPMSDDAAVLLARTLLDRDEPVLGANGALPAGPR